MSDRLHVSTRKGLFIFDRNVGGGWEISQTAFLGDNVTLNLHDPRSGVGDEATLYAALDHGHFGVKLHRSDNGGADWKEIGSPEYPEKPADYAPKTPPMEGTDYDWTLKLVWALSAGGPEQPGRLWCGTLPGGLFRSDDHGETWEMDRVLWDDPRREAWFGGGADVPGIHSICVNPRDADHLTLAISCGGVWITRDGG